MACLNKSTFDAEVGIPGEAKTIPALSCKGTKKEKVLQGIILTQIAQNTMSIGSFPMCLLDIIVFVFSLSTRISKMKNFTLGVHLDFQTDLNIGWA
jgi:hypothetical protein